MNIITPVDNTNNIRYADFVRITTTSGTYRFSTAPASLTIPAVDSQPFDALGQLIKVGDAQRDIKSTANETTFTLVGIDTAMLGFVLGQDIKGSQIEAWHGFFDTNGALITTGGTGGLYQFFNGYISSFSINEQWMEETRSYVGLITVSASSIQTNPAITHNIFLYGNVMVLGDGLGSLTINNTINSSLIPTNDAVNDLGSASYRWNNLYVSTLNVTTFSPTNLSVSGNTTLGDGVGGDTVTFNGLKIKIPGIPSVCVLASLYIFLPFLVSILYHTIFIHMQKEPYIYLK